jgi:hypothetical protein
MTQEGYFTNNISLEYCAYRHKLVIEIIYFIDEISSSSIAL